MPPNMRCGWAFPYYKNEDLRRRMAHWSGQALGSAAGEEVARELSCKSLNTS